MVTNLALAFVLTLITSAAKSEPVQEEVLQCERPGHQISPMVYGIAYSPRHEKRDVYRWELNPGARRWGGNPASRYNWRLGNAWNTGADWFFMNVDYTNEKTDHWRRFLLTNRQRGVASALTIPLLGWVAKDTSSPGFPVATLGPQRRTAPHHPNAGDGHGRDGKQLNAIDRRRTSVAFEPPDLAAWVREIRSVSKDGLVNMYILGNEPMLWHVTHRDVRTSPVSYDELLERTIAYGSALRRADPKAVIAGPAVWGWPAYFFSAVDAEAGFRLKPDRRMHGDEPLLAWYLRKLREHERKTGVRIIDVLDVHYYPQAKGVFLNQRTDAEAAATRLRATRSWWDPTYQDESWINESVHLLPRLEALVRKNYPGLGIAIGEYNFGGEDHVSGALALAETLGRFTQSELLKAAFYWTYPPHNSPAYHAFRAFRNYDGKGARFQDISVPVQRRRGDHDISVFASKNPEGTQVVAVVLNLLPNKQRTVHLDLSKCGEPKAVASYRYVASGGGLRSSKGAALRGGKIVDRLPPYSLSVYAVQTGAETARR